MSELKVVTHVGRDLLSSAAAFKNEAAAVWEYVVNSLQYTDPGNDPVVQVDVHPRNRTIIVSDNGRGLDDDSLQHFFTMHGENLERQEGRIGRGKFGTGKSAAFGVGNEFEIDTVRSGKRNVVKLTREMIERSAGEEIPLSWLIRNEAVDSPNGTTITISDVFLKPLLVKPIIEYIERHLVAYRGSKPKVAVNEHFCEYREPEVVSEHEFLAPKDQFELLDGVSLTVKTSRAPLPRDEWGISITAGTGNLVAKEDCGVCSKEYGNYLFGDVDAPALETHDSPIEPYDDSRSMRLNDRNPVATELLIFVSQCLEKARGELVEQSKQARKREEARRLSKEASKIADILNRDFKDVSEKLREVRSATKTRVQSAKGRFGESDNGGGETDDWVEGGDTPGVVARTTGSGTGEGTGRPAPDVAASGQPDDRATDRVQPAGGAHGNRKPKGGFNVQFEHLGKESDRSQYDPNRLTILINLDHPVIANAMRTHGVEHTVFRRLTYEVAFSEYAMAFGYEVANEDPDIPADDLLFDIRNTLHRISRSAAGLYLADDR